MHASGGRCMHASGGSCIVASVGSVDLYIGGFYDMDN